MGTGQESIASNEAPWAETDGRKGASEVRRVRPWCREQCQVGTGWEVVEVWLLISCAVVGQVGNTGWAE